MATTYILKIGENDQVLPARTALKDARAKADAAHTDNPALPVSLRTKATNKVIAEYTPAAPDTDAQDAPAAPQPEPPAPRAPKGKRAAKAPAPVADSAPPAPVTDTADKPKRKGNAKRGQTTDTPADTSTPPTQENKRKGKRAARVTDNPAPVTDTHPTETTPPPSVDAPGTGGRVGKYALNGTPMQPGTTKLMALDAAQDLANDTGLMIVVTNTRTGNTVREIAPTTPASVANLISGAPATAPTGDPLAGIRRTLDAVEEMTRLADAAQADADRAVETADLAVSNGGGKTAKDARKAARQTREKAHALAAMARNARLDMFGLIG